MKCSLALLSLCLLGQTWALDNGLALTPPMGWLTWQRFRCNIDCKNDPDNCIGEKLIKDMADRMSADGFLKAGYEYLIIDDCWLAKERAPDGQLQGDPERFPSGMKKLADYVHSKGLKFGIYEDFGTHTCAGYPGSEYFMEMDAQTFADWGVDYLKLDGCYSNIEQYDEGYPPVAFYLNKTKRDIMLSCEYPAYQRQPNYTAVAAACNCARNHNDIQDSWDSVKTAINYYGDDKGGFSKVAKPGFFNDPDMLLLGNYGISYQQERVQMGMWAMMASPLIMSVDLRDLRHTSHDLLLNPRVIAINQDKLGKQGTRIHQSGNTQVWTKPLSGGSTAFALLNFGTNGMPQKVSLKMADLGLMNGSGYNVTEVFDNTPMGTLRPQDNFTASVNPSGIFLGMAVPL